MKNSRSTFPFQLFAAMTLALAAPAIGAPFTYTVQFTAGAFSGADPLGLGGAVFTMQQTWDSSSLATEFDNVFTSVWTTQWPSTNTVTTLTVAGSTSGNGVYSGSTAGNSWVLYDNRTGPPLADVVQFPAAVFTLPGSTSVRIDNLFEKLNPATIASGSATIHPFAFLNSDRISGGQTARVEYIATGSNASGTDQTVSAEAAVAGIPEPSTFLLAAIGIGGGLLVRRRALRQA